MPRPGWDVLTRTAPIPPQIPTDTGVGFVVGGSAIGPVVPTLIQSLDQYVTIFGARTGGVVLYDHVDVFFREGGSKLWVCAVPTTPSMMQVQASEVPGLEEEVDEKQAAKQAKAAEEPETRAAPTTPQLQACLDKLTKAYGPGQVWCPGNVDPTLNTYLLQHALNTNRCALIEPAAASTAAQLTTYAAVYKTNPGVQRSALFAPLGIFPGVTPGTTRPIGWTAVVAGQCAYNDGHGINPDTPAAGVNGISDYAVDVELRYLDSEYTSLSQNGVNTAQYRWGALETFGWRTLADPVTIPDWWSFGFSRLRMAIEADAGAVAETYVFSQLDGRGHTIADFGNDLRAVLAPYYDSGALYGSTPEEAFQVNVGPAVNTPATIANGELHAVLMVRMSPFAEYVVIEIAKVSTTQAIAA